MPRSRPRRLVVLATVPVLLGAALAGSGTATGQPAPAEAPIRLATGDFLPSALPATRGVKALGATERGSYLVQFDGPIREEWKAGLLGAGAVLVDYIPENAYRVRMNPGQAARAESLPGVRWVGRFAPAWKVTADARAEISEGGPAVYEVTTEPGADRGAVATAARATGAVVSTSGSGTLLLAATPVQATSVAGIEGVAVVDGFRVHEKHNEHAAGTVMKGTAATARGYDGSTQVVAVADTGLGGGTTATAHPDIPASRIVAIRDWPGENIPNCATVLPDGPHDVDSGHGTHVAVSAVGDGTTDGRGTSAAPGARLVFQAIEDYVDTFGSCAGSPDGYYLFGIPIDLGPLFQQAYDDGARIHANSWGSDAAGAYTEDSRAADKFANEHRDMLITFSAGNAGVDADANGVIDPRSVGSPGTAKNVLTVGASENGKTTYPCDPALTYQAQSAGERATMGNRSCQQAGGANVIPTWGDWWSTDYPVNPLRTDPQTGNANQMAAFSSRGPASDGRIKPDVVAPGSWILSGYSDRYQQQYDGGAVNPRTGLAQHDGYGFPYSDDYKYFSGTSMSNPLVAGGAAVVRDFYKEHHGIDASAALVKGTLVNSATDLLDENGDGANDNDFPVPNIHEGWGLVNLDKATAGTAMFVDENTGMVTGGVTETRYQVTAGAPLKITLAYTDKEASSLSGPALVNNLDLEVFSPSGVAYRGNMFTGGFAQPNPSGRDSANNLENVFVAAPEAGEWTVRVRGVNVPFGPQKFAAVVDGRVAPAPGELLRNGGFESGAANWTGQTTAITNGTARPAQAGTWYARLGGTGRKSTETLYQQFTVPTSATSITATFWVRVDTAETTTTGQYDKLQLRVLSTGVAVLATLGTVSNLDSGGGYVQKTHDLGAYKGQTIRLAWVATEDSSRQTTFAVDTASVRVVP